MISLRCKKVISICSVLFTFTILLICLSFDTGNKENEFIDILLILSFFSLPVTIMTAIYYYSILENVNAVANIDF